MKSITLLIYLVCTAFLANAQDGNVAKGVIPASPNVASLLAYSQIPVSKYTGVPAIEIPIYTIKSGALELPLSISYHASGIKTAQEASWVGLGWALNAGGTISRSIRGLDDFSLSAAGYSKNQYPNNILYDAQWVPTRESTPSSEAYLNDIFGQTIDTEPDLFYFNFAGYSGKFYLEKQSYSNEIVGTTLDLKNNLKIQSLESGNKWLITDAKGIKYYFGTIEYNYPESYQQQESTETSSHGPYYPFDQNVPDITIRNAFCEDLKTIGSWYIDKIVSPNGDEIDFGYTTAGSCTGVASPAAMSMSRYKPNAIPNSQPVLLEYNFYKTITQEVLLNQITFKDGSVSFLTGSRSDIAAINYSPQKLEAIVISNNDQTAMQNIHFSFGNFDLGRLKLQGMTINGKPYQFTYNEAVQLPLTTTKSFDYWGYFNNANNTSVLPRLDFYGHQIYQYGGNMEANELYTQAGILKEIKYPTGGKTVFEYEGNKFQDHAPIYENKGFAVEASKNYYPSGSNPTFSQEDFYLNDVTVVTFTGSASSNHPCNEVGPSGDYAFALLASIPYQGAPSYTSIEDYYYNPSEIKKTLVYKECGDNNNQTSVYYNYTLTLNAGWYRLVVEPIDKYVANAEVTYTQIVGYKEERIGGGLRVKRINSYDKINSVPSVIKYEYTGSETLTSGIVQTRPEFQFNTYIQYYKRDTYGSGTGNSQTDRELMSDPYIISRSSSFSPLSTSAQGAFIGYSKVTEMLGENGENGKRISYFKNTANSSTVNTPPIEDVSNGLLESESIFNSSGNITQSTHNTYLRDVAMSRTLRAMAVETYSFVRDFDLGNDPESSGILAPSYLVNYYNVKCDWWKLAQTINTDLTTTGNVVTTTDYTYNPLNKQVFTSTKTESNNAQSVIRYKYAVDYNSSAGAVYPAMVAANMIGMPVEIQTWKKNANNETLISSQITEFKTFYNKFIAPYRFYRMEPVANILSSQLGYSSSTIGQFSNLFPTGTFFGLEREFDYSDQGRTIRVTQSGRLSKSYIWGYNNEYPIAEILNTLPKDVFYTSFEGAEGNSAAGDSKTGKKSHWGNYTHDLINLTNGRYVLNYWRKNGQIWEQVISSVEVGNGGYIISLSGQIDELRFYPEAALMTTYTYLPLVGISSMTDAKGLITTYEYDTFQRLKSIKDPAGNTIKTYDYHYKD